MLVSATLMGKMKEIAASRKREKEADLADKNRMAGILAEEKKRQTELLKELGDFMQEDNVIKKITAYAEHREKGIDYSVFDIGMVEKSFTGPCAKHHKQKKSKKYHAYHSKNNAAGWQLDQDFAILQNQ